MEEWAKRFWIAVSAGVAVAIIKGILDSIAPASMNFLSTVISMPVWSIITVIFVIGIAFYTYRGWKSGGLRLGTSFIGGNALQGPFSKAGKYWETHKNQLWKVNLIASFHQSPPLAVGAVDGPLCTKCKTTLSKHDKGWLEFLQPKYKWICPNCQHVCYTQEDGDALEDEVSDIIRGKIERNELTQMSNSIEWEP